MKSEHPSRFLLLLGIFVSGFIVLYALRPSSDPGTGKDLSSSAASGSDSSSGSRLKRRPEPEAKLHSHDRGDSAAPDLAGAKRAERSVVGPVKTKIRIGSPASEKVERTGIEARSEHREKGGKDGERISGVARSPFPGAGSFGENSPEAVPSPPPFSQERAEEEEKVPEVKDYLGAVNDLLEKSKLDSSDAAEANPELSP